MCTETFKLFDQNHFVVSTVQRSQDVAAFRKGAGMTESRSDLLSTSKRTSVINDKGLRVHMLEY